jgi:hypothetical protein
MSLIHSGAWPAVRATGTCHVSPVLACLHHIAQHMKLRARRALLRLVLVTLMMLMYMRPGRPHVQMYTSGARTRRQPLKRAAWCGAGGVVKGGSAWPSGPTRPHASGALMLLLTLSARQWCAVASVAVWSLYPVHAMPCARQWCAAASAAVWRACGMVARVHHALGPLGQKLRQMSVGGSVVDEDVCSRGVGAHTHDY